MANLLKNLVITKVALVDEGSCSSAHIKLYKRKERGNTMGFEEILKSLPEDQQAVIKEKMTTMEADKKTAEDAKKVSDAAKMAADAKATKAEEGKMAAEAEMAKMKGDAGKSDDDILKNVDPAIKAMIEKARLQAEAAEEAVKKMRDEKDNAEVESIAKSFSGIPMEEAKMVELLKKGKKTDLYTELTEALQIANSAITKSATFTVVGQDAGNADPIAKSKDEAWTAVENKAIEISKARSITKEAATQVVITEHRELYNAYLDTLK